MCPKRSLVVTHKIRESPELLKRLDQAFSAARYISPSEKLTRAELKKLERMGKVERVPLHQKSKFLGVTGTVQYVWRKI